MDDPKSKRRNPRRKIRVPVLCWETEEEKAKGRGKELIPRDISVDGMGFYSDVIYPIGSTLFFEIFLPGKEKPISCGFEIVRMESLVNRDDYLVGGIFRGISSDDISAIAKAIGNMNIYLLLESALQGGASDLHLTVGRPPMVRLDGRILPMAADIIEDGQVEAMMFPLLEPEQVELFQKKKELDFAFSPTLNSRFRVNLHQQKGYVEAALRNIPTKVSTFEDLGLPQQITNFCHQKSGLFLIAGTTGSGKTTTMSSMVQYLNTNREMVIVTIEDPIEYTFKSQKSIIKQRELGSDTASYSEGLKRVLRQDPDVICVGELLDGECLLQAMRAAETGHLVISTIHAPSTGQAIERVVNFFPPEHKMNICQQLSSSLNGIIYQSLLPDLNGGRVLATELLINNHAMANLIREAKYKHIVNVLQTGRSLGMYPLKHNLDKLVSEGRIDQKQADELLKKEKYT